MRRFSRLFLCLVCTCLAGTQVRAENIAIRYSGGTYDIVSVDPDSGRQRTLVANAFAEYWAGSFVTDPAAGFGYVLTSILVSPPPNPSFASTFFRFDLVTGEVFNQPTTNYTGPLALGADGDLVGIQPVSEGRYDILSVNSRTGAVRTLLPNAVSNYMWGSFISDPVAGVGYIISDSKVLLQFELSTGRRIAEFPINYDGPLALGSGGKLIGIRPSGGSFDIVTIDLYTGRIATLVQNAFANYYWGTFTTDVESGVGRVLTADEMLFQFDLVSGSSVAPKRRVRGKIRDMDIGVRKVSAGSLTYRGKRVIFTRKPFVTVRGKASKKINDVSYRVGSSSFKPAVGVQDWAVKARVRRGLNRLAIHATSPEGKIADTIITIVRK